MDITVADYDRGAFLPFEASSFIVPIAWRPEIVMTARVYSLETDERAVICSVRQKYAWNRWLRKIVNIRTYIGDGFRLRQDEMEVLVQQVCVNLLVKVRNELR
jgi:hypothetical protein